MWPAIRHSLIAAGIDVPETIAQRPGEAGEAAERAARDGAEIVVAIGGDGTLNEALNGLMRVPAATRPALAFVPGGTANIFARALGLPTAPPDVVRLLLTGIRRRIDVGQVNGHFYATVAGVGFDGELVGRACRWPRIGGSKTIHLAAFLATLATYRSPVARVVLDGHRRDMNLTFLSAANTDWYGGGLHIAPGALPDDGRLDVVYTQDLTRIDTVAVALRTFSGRHLQHYKVTREVVQDVRVESDVPLGIHADGEWLGRGQATIRIVPKALDVVILRREP
ncbi:MAG: hypothetical protein A2V59_08640 [Armatimonadetes bacterium RBG_19FT_COMBO_69_19]|nr:MAG: hypothetical protein A2V59_08640 [Armatimonadetes bacterium RBG_19FT_COMBO_69_19]